MGDDDRTGTPRKSGSLSTSIDGVSSHGLADVDQFYSRAEVVLKILSLSTAERKTINACIEKQAKRGKGVFSARDIKMEAYTRIFATTRQWPRKYTAEQFFTGSYGIIRSITTGFIRKNSNRPTVSLDEKNHGFYASELSDWTSHTDRKIDAAKIIRLVEASLINNVVASEVFRLWLLGYEKSEVMHELEINEEKIYDAALKLLRRRIVSIREKILKIDQCGEM